MNETALKANTIYLDRSGTSAPVEIRRGKFVFATHGTWAGTVIIQQLVEDQWKTFNKHLTKKKKPENFYTQCETDEPITLRIVAKVRGRHFSVYIRETYLLVELRQEEKV